MDKKIRTRKVVAAKAKPPLAGKAVAAAHKAGALAPVAVAPAPKAILKSPLTKAELDEFRKMLLEKRRGLLGDMSGMEAQTFHSNRQDRSGDLSNIPIHPADVGTDNFEQEFTLGLLESERSLLREIDEALERIDDGTYGICMGTNKPIDKARLRARPWANGDDCFVLKAIVPAPEDLSVIVDAIGRFGAVTTSVVLRSEPTKPISRKLLKAAMR